MVLLFMAQIIEMISLFVCWQARKTPLLLLIRFLQKTSYRISQVTLAKPYIRDFDEVTILIYMYDRNDLICESISERTILDRAFSDLTSER